MFKRKEASELVERVLSASKEPTLYQITDYHWLILYEALKACCDDHNNMARDSESGVLPVGPYELGEIDFDSIVDRFFWDVDFLEGEGLLDLTPDQRRRQLGFVRCDWTAHVQAAVEREQVLWDVDEGWPGIHECTSVSGSGVRQGRPVSSSRSVREPRKQRASRPVR